MKEKIMNLSELGALLEYEDERSIINWCKKNKIPVIYAGKAKYVLTLFVDRFFENQFNSFINTNYDQPDQIINAMQSSDLTELTRLMEAPMHKSVKRKYQSKIKERSVASQKFLNKINAA
jgi:hypothetical protein